MIPIIALHHAAIICYAVFFEAYDDFKQISRQEPIGHKSQFLVRVGIACILTAMAGHAAVKYCDANPWIYAPLLLACWPLFSLPFRVALNRLRKKPWWYTSPSSEYDWVFLRLVSPVNPKMRKEINDDWKRVGESHVFMGAGIAESLTELTVFAIACWWMAQLM